MCCRFVWAGMSAEVSECGVGVYGLRISAKVSVCMDWLDECGGVCGVGVYGLGMSAEVSVVSVCMGWG